MFIAHSWLVMTKWQKWTCKSLSLSIRMLKIPLQWTFKRNMLICFKWSITENYGTLRRLRYERINSKQWNVSSERLQPLILQALSILCTVVKSAEERNKYYSVFFRKWLKGLWDKISLCSSKCWERYLLIMFHSSYCALPLMECLPLAFQRRQPIKATHDSRWCVVRSFDSFCLFESDIFIPSPRIWGLFGFFLQCLMQELSTLFLFTPAF